MTNPPLVTIVTPTLNAGPHLVETIESVLSQDYSRIEYVVVDGGSTDNTNEILARYADRLVVIRAGDSGAADAINIGFRQGSGEICAWLGGDDTLLPGSVSAAVSKLTSDPALGAVYGEASWTNTDGSVIGPYPTSPHAVQYLHSECLICQPSAFVTRWALQRVGYLDPNLKSAFDYDLWIRLSRVARFGYLHQNLATSRMHRANITFAHRQTGLQEKMTLLHQHFGYVPFQAVYSYCSYRLDRRDQFFEPLRRSVRAFRLSLFYGMSINRGRRLKFLREWASAIRIGGFRNLTVEYFSRGRATGDGNTGHHAGSA